MDKSRENIKRLGHNILNFYKNLKYKIIKEKDTKIIVACFATLALIIVCLYGNVSSKKRDVIEQLSNSLSKGNERALLNLIEDGNQGFGITKEDLVPYIKFFKADKGRINKLVYSLENGDEIYSTKLESRKGFWGEKWYVVIEKRKLIVSSNFPEASVYLNDNFIGTINTSRTLEIPNLIPGLYDIKIEKRAYNSNLVEEKNVVFMNNDKVDIPLNGILVTAKSSFEDSNVYINGEDSGIKVKDFKDVGPFPKDGSAYLTIKCNTPWGKIDSQKFYIEDHPEINIELDLKDTVVKDDVEKVIKEFYSSVFQALNSEDKNYIKDANDEVKDNIYSILSQKYFLLKNDYDISDLKIKMENSSIERRHGIYEANIVVNVSYKIKKKILGIDVKSESIEKNFFTNAKYDNGKWIIYNVQDFSLPGLEEEHNN